MKDDKVRPDVPLKDGLPYETIEIGLIGERHDERAKCVEVVFCQGSENERFA